MFGNPDPHPLTNLDEPTLPEHYETLDHESKEQADELFRRRMLHWLYLIFTGNYQEYHFDVIEMSLRVTHQALVARASMPWTGNCVNLKALMLTVTEKLVDAQD